MTGLGVGRRENHRAGIQEFAKRNRIRSTQSGDVIPAGRVKERRARRWLGVDDGRTPRLEWDADQRATKPPKIEAMPKSPIDEAAWRHDAEKEGHSGTSQPMPVIAGEVNKGWQKAIS
jgi:hypothetical protein